MTAGPAEPGSGWPGDLATPLTPVAHSPAEVRDLAASAGSLEELVARQSVCRACPRLVGWREQVATAKRRSFQAEAYWGRPIPGWGDDRPGILIVGLAPAAHGGNRTGRIFTGDRSGDFLFASLYRCGLAASPESVWAGDGQRLIGARMVAAVRCAPPANKPTPAERDTCAPWLVAELVKVVPSLRVIVCLGGFAWQAVWPSLAAAGFTIPRPRPPFGHGAEVIVGYQGDQHQPDVPQESSAPQTPGSPQASKAPQAPGARQASSAQKAPGTPQGSEAPQAPGARQASSAQRTPDAPQGSEAAQAPGSPQASKAPQAPGARQASSAHQAPGTHYAPSGQPRPSTRQELGSDHGPVSPQPGWAVAVIGCYHPSQQNTFTGRVTPEMLDAVFLTAVERLRS